MLPAFRCPLENKESQQLTLEQTGPSRRLARPAYQYLCSRAKVESSGHGQVHASLGGRVATGIGESGHVQPRPWSPGQLETAAFLFRKHRMSLSQQTCPESKLSRSAPPLLTDLPSALCGQFQNQGSVTKLRHREKHHRCGRFNLTWTSAQLSHSLGAGSLHSGWHL